MKKRECDDCGEEFERKRDAKIINGTWLCRGCYKERRIQRRKETIKEARRLEKPVIKKRKLKQGKEKIKPEDFPKIKGAKKTKRDKNYSYLTMYEKQALFKMLMNRGIEFDEAKERLRDLVQEQKRVREYMKDKGKSEEQIKVKQMEMIEELWNM